MGCDLRVYGWTDILLLWDVSGVRMMDVYPFAYLRDLEIGGRL